jgi:cell division protein FtsB
MRSVRRTFVIAVLIVAAAWMAYAYAQEAMVGRRLAQEAAQLRQQNSLIAAQNDGYRKDVKALTSGAADEEEARLNGYSRPQERVYLITAPPSPSPAASSPSTAPSTTP